MENILKPKITIKEIDGLFYIIISDKYRHFRGFKFIGDLYESVDFIHYTSKFGYSEE